MSPCYFFNIESSYWKFETTIWMVRIISWLDLFPAISLIYFFMYARFGLRCYVIFCQISFSAILVNTQCFMRSWMIVPLQKPSIQPYVPSVKPSFCCGTQVSIPLIAFNGTNLIYRLAHIQTSFIRGSLTT